MGYACHRRSPCINIYEPVRSDSEIRFNNLYLGIGLGVSLVIISGSIHLAFDLDIELYLRLCSGRTDTDFGAIGSKELQNVGCGRHIHRHSP